MTQFSPYKSYQFVCKQNLLSIYLSDNISKIFIIYSIHSLDNAKRCKHHQVTITQL